MILSSIAFPLGMITILLFLVIILVRRISISSTFPVSHSSSIRSPIWYGLNMRIRTHPAKLARLHWSARPTARPAAQMIATNEVVSTHIILATLTTRSALRTKLIRLLINLAIVISKCPLERASLTNLVARLITFIHHRNTAMASSILGQYEMILSTISWVVDERFEISMMYEAEEAQKKLERLKSFTLLSGPW